MSWFITSQASCNPIIVYACMSLTNKKEKTLLGKAVLPKVVFAYKFRV